MTPRTQETRLDSASRATDRKVPQMTETQVNIPLLRKAVEWAEAEAAKPFEIREWLQESWVTPATPADAEAWGGDAEGCWVVRDYGKSSECGTCYCIAGYVVQAIVGPIPRSIAEKAAELLGIDYQPRAHHLPGNRLFSGGNSIEDVRRIAEGIAGERL